MPEKYAFKMRLKPGMKAEYQKRHDEIWPELLTLLRDAGISDYSIHFDAETGALFAVLWRRDGHKMDGLASHQLMRRWWRRMSDLLEMKPDQEPVVIPLETVFHMP